MRKTGISMKSFLLVAGIGLLFAVVGPASAGTTYLVWTNGTQTTPYDTWAKAFSNIQDAVTYASDGDLVWATNGTYTITNQITITKGVTVQSVKGAGDTIVKRSGANRHRIFYLGHSNAILDGLTITNGYPTDNGGGVYITNGTVKNCTISGNTVDAGMYGGGVCMYSGGGVVSNCTISGNTGKAGGNNTMGAGVYCSPGSLVVNCVISSNSGAGGAFCWFGGTVRNCLISGNTAAGYGGGVYFRSGGTVENCTIVGNTSVHAGGGVGYKSGGGGTISNTICFFNTAPLRPNIYGETTGSVSYSCVTPSVSGGSGNTTADPLFVNRAGNNYRLLPGSPCINTGSNQVWMIGATDLDGSNRIEYGTVDMGAYEFRTNALMCSFTADSPMGFAPHQVIFTSYVSSTNTGGLWYQWNYGNGIYAEGADKQVVTNTYSNGTYSVSLTVTNAVGESNSYTRANYIKAGPSTIIYVVSSGSPAFPYTNWATAATNIQTAVDAGVDGTLVLVTNGTYTITNQITITDGITVQSVNGATNTIVKRIGASKYRIFHLSHSNAVVDGFTITNGAPAIDESDNGAGVLLYGAGTVRNCTITGNTLGASEYVYGGGVCCWYGGVVSNCTISRNTANENSHGGGVACYLGGLVVNCVISGNTNAAGGVYLNGGGTVRNCLISGNVQGKIGGGTTWGGGGVYLLWGGTVQNCTIVSNTAAGTAGGGVYWAGAGSVENSIIYFNTTNNYNSTSAFTYSCTTPGVAAVGNISNDPGFVDLNQRNYHLARGSPCINTGTNQDWMIGATDLDGNPRRIGSRVDLGAYEYVPPKGAIISAW